MSKHPRCPYCCKVLNSEDKVGATISINGMIGQDKNFKQQFNSKRWITDNTKEVKICKACVVFVEFGVMPMLKAQLDVLKHKMKVLGFIY